MEHAQYIDLKEIIRRRDSVFKRILNSVNEVDRKKSELDQAKNEKKKMELETDRYIGGLVQGCKTEIAAAQRREEQYKIDLEALQNKYAMSQNRNAEKDGKLACMEKIIGEKNCNLSCKAKKYKEECEDSKKRLKEQTHKTRQAEVKVTALLEEEDERKKIVRQAEWEKEKVLREMEDLEDRNRILSNEIDALQARLVQLEAAGEKNVKEALDSHKTELKNKLDEVSTIAKAEAKVSKAQDALKKAEKAKEVMIINEEELRRQISELEKVNAAISLCVKQSSNEASALKEQVSEMEDEIARLQLPRSDSKFSLESEVQQQKRRVQELSKALEESKGLRVKELSTQSEDLTRLIQENNSLGLTVEEWMKKFQVKEAELYASLDIRRKQLNTIMELKGNIRVFCRVRPFLRGEASGGKIVNFTFEGDKTIRALPVDTSKRPIDTQFSFDHVFGPQAKQEDVFEEISDLIQSALDGYKVCIFAYGQTGSGKTHTMIGGDSDNWGMIPRSVEQILRVAAGMEEQGWTFRFIASFIEIYNETCRDLLVEPKPTSKDKKLDVKIESRTNMLRVPGLTIEDVSNKREILKLLAKSNRNRATAETAMNETSSRSHSVFQLAIEANDL